MSAEDIVILDPSADESTHRVTLDEKITYLKRYIDTVSIADRMSVGKVLIKNGERARLVKCAEGCVIRLDVLDEKCITQMYETLKVFVGRNKL